MGFRHRTDGAGFRQWRRAGRSLGARAAFRAPKREKEALRIFENLDAVLRAAGTDRANLVRTDQYYTTVEAVPPYQQVRREFLSGRIPPSTSIAQQRLLLPAADMNIQAMAIIPETGFEVEHLKHEHLQGARPRAIRPR